MKPILALDPGTTHTAWCEYDGKTVSFDKVPNEVLIDQLWLYTGNKIVVEMIASYGMPVGAEVFQTCVWIGRYIERIKSHQITSASGGSNSCELRFRRDVKLHHCGSPKANDATIRQALVDRFGGKGTKKKPGMLYGMKADCWQAFALAVMVYDETLAGAKK